MIRGIAAGGSTSSGGTGTGGVLAKLTGANLNSTADQPITGLPSKYQITEVIATNASGSVTTAVGGVYTGAGKTGTKVIYNGQVYSALTTASGLVVLSFDIGSSALAYSGGTLYFSLTTPQGSAMTCDIYVIGNTLP
jgi:hypothetical protein